MFISGKVEATIMKYFEYFEKQKISQKVNTCVTKKHSLAQGSFFIPFRAHKFKHKTIKIFIFFRNYSHPKVCNV